MVAISYHDIVARQVNIQRHFFPFFNTLVPSLSCWSNLKERVIPALLNDICTTLAHGGPQLDRGLKHVSSPMKFTFDQAGATDVLQC